jgi:hypothetical protein
LRKFALIVVALCMTSTVTAEAKQSLCERAYVARIKVTHRYGGHAVGRNICRRGVITKGARYRAGAQERFIARPATVKEKYRYWVYLRSLARPAPPFLGKIPSYPRRGRAGVMSWHYVPVGVAACIVSGESGGNPRATNGQYGGIAQWSPEAWGRMGGHRYAAYPQAASYQDQLLVLSHGLVVYGTRDWKPYDGCG